MSLLATRMQKLRLLNPTFDSNMTRPCEYGALDFFVSQSDSGRSFVNPALAEAAMNSIGRTLEMPVIDYDAGVTVSNVRTCTIADQDNVSALYTVVFSTFGVGFTMVPSLHMNNDISYDHDFNRKMEKVIRALADALDVAAVATLAANRTQVFKDVLDYPVAGDTINADENSRFDILGDIDPIMRANCYPGQLHIVGNAGIDSLIRKLGQLGNQNAINKVLEYAGKTLHYTNNVLNETGKYATGYAVEDGNVGYLTRSGREYLRRLRIDTHEFDIVRMPLINLPVDTHYYRSLGDQSAVAGESSADMICNEKEYFGMELDIAFMVKYNSDPTTIAQPIIKFDIESLGTPRSAGVPVFNTN